MLFVIFLIFIMVMYQFVWKMFVSRMQNELWKTKFTLR